MKNSSLALHELETMIPDKEVRAFLMELVNALPNIVVILNEDRRLVYSNQVMLDKISISNFEEVFHLRPGNLFRCVNSDTEPGGCGASAACQLCGAFRALEDSRIRRERVTNECRILGEKEGRNNAYNFRFTSTPFCSANALFFVVSIEDISHEKRREELERLFFHDMINSLSGLHGVIHLLEEEKSVSSLYMNILQESYNNLYRLIDEQKELHDAEEGYLRVRPEKIDLPKLMKGLVETFRSNKNNRVDIVLIEVPADIELISDETLLMRIITNMLKNAVEASEENDTILVSAAGSHGAVRIAVHNSQVIPQDVQLQIFERSYSTKGMGRGLGTYSMKLFGENYLGGKVGFVSNEVEGTTFFIRLPAS